MHNTPSLVETPKWRVKWKTVNRTPRQTSATTIISDITPSNSSPALPQVLARSAANGWKSASNIQGSYRMQQNPFVRMQDGCTFNAGHVTSYGVHIGPWHGDANSINITTHHTAPMWYEGPPQGVFYEGFMPPGAPGFGGGPRTQQ